MAKKDTQEVQIHEVRNKRTSIFIHYAVGNDDFAVTFHDNPLKSFYTALENLNEHVLALAELPKGDLPKIEATGITLRTKGENTLALITAKKTLKRNKRVLNIATPILPMYPDDENKAVDHMSDDEASAVEKVIKEAKRYIAGDRAQGQIEFQEPEKEKGDKAKGGETVEFPGMEPGAQAAK